MNLRTHVITTYVGVITGFWHTFISLFHSHSNIGHLLPKTDYYMSLSRAIQRFGAASLITPFGVNSTPKSAMGLPRVLLLAALLVCAEIEHAAAISCLHKEDGGDPVFTKWWVGMTYPKDQPAHMFHHQGPEIPEFQVHFVTVGRFPSRLHAGPTVGHFAGSQRGVQGHLECCEGRTQRIHLRWWRRS